jgi:endonuclease/exonuclease/phosphatase family metal-dependent hydrolase
VSSETLHVKEAEILTSYVSKYIRKYPVYICGDFNLPSTEASYAVLTKEYYDARFIAKTNLNGIGGGPDGDDFFINKTADQEVIFYRAIDKNSTKFGDYAVEGGISDHHAVYIKVRIG